jgi:hypothetical protein
MRRGRKVILVVVALVVVALLAFTANYCGGSTNKKAPIPSPPPTLSSMSLIQ